MKSIKLLFISLFALWWPLASHAATVSGGPVDGQVLEEGTNKPIPGAIVVIRWQGDVGGPVESSTTCYHVETATTDEQGRFHIKAWKTPRDAVSPPPSPYWLDRILGGSTIRNTVTLTTAYHPGYTFSTKPPEKNIVWLKPFTGTQGERLRVTAGAAVTCGSNREVNKTLLPLYRQLYEEARPLAVTKDDKRILSDLLFQIETIELPYNEALDRNSERLNAIDREK